METDIYDYYRSLDQRQRFYFRRFVVKNLLDENQSKEQAIELLVKLRALNKKNSLEKILPNLHIDFKEALIIEAVDQFEKPISKQILKGILGINELDIKNKKFASALLYALVHLEIKPEIQQMLSKSFKDLILFEFTKKQKNLKPEQKGYQHIISGLIAWIVQTKKGFDEIDLASFQRLGLIKENINKEYIKQRLFDFIISKQYLTANEVKSIAYFVNPSLEKEMQKIAEIMVKEDVFRLIIKQYYEKTEEIVHDIRAEIIIRSSEKNFRQLNENVLFSILFLIDRNDSRIELINNKLGTKFNKKIDVAKYIYEKEGHIGFKYLIFFDFDLYVLFVKYRIKKVIPAFLENEKDLIRFMLQTILLKLMEENRQKEIKELIGNKDLKEILEYKAYVPTKALRIFDQTEEMERLIENAGIHYIETNLMPEFSASLRVSCLKQIIKKKLDIYESELICYLFDKEFPNIEINFESHSSLVLYLKARIVLLLITNLNDLSFKILSKLDIIEKDYKRFKRTGFEKLKRLLIFYVLSKASIDNIEFETFKKLRIIPRDSVFHSDFFFDFLRTLDTDFLNDENVDVVKLRKNVLLFITKQGYRKKDLELIEKIYDVLVNDKQIFELNEYKALILALLYYDIKREKTIDKDQFFLIRSLGFNHEKTSEKFRQGKEVVELDKEIESWIKTFVGINLPDDLVYWGIYRKVEKIVRKGVSKKELQALGLAPDLVSRIMKKGLFLHSP